jgi:hypothetical protein
MPKPKLYRVKTEDMHCSDECYYKNRFCDEQCRGGDSGDDLCPHIIIDHFTLLKKRKEAFSELESLREEEGILYTRIKEQMNKIGELSTCEEYKD